jgi:fructoselysine-6-P-deglycase FrlB-like protein
MYPRSLVQPVTAHLNIQGRLKSCSFREIFKSVIFVGTGPALCACFAIVYLADNACVVPASIINTANIIYGS